MLIACRNGMAAKKAGGGGAKGEGLLFRAYPGGADVSLSSTTGSYKPSLLYSTDEEKTWSPYTVGSAVHVDGGKSVSFKANGTNPTMGTDWGKWNTFQVTNGYASVEGHLSSLLGHDVLSNFVQFQAIFRGSPGIADASGLRFRTNWTRAEAASTQACYCGLFQYCPSLTAVPKFNMPGGAYTPQDAFNGMFQECTALSDATDFGLGDEPWLSVGYATFFNMFKGCPQLTAAPVVQRSNRFRGDDYSYMFQNCSKLAQLSVELTSWPGTSNWLASVSASGDFYCPAALGTNATIERGASKCPNNWTVINPGSRTLTTYSDGSTSLDYIGGEATRADFEAIIQGDGKTSADIYGVDFGNAVSAVGPSCFADWGGLREVKIGDNVERIGDNAFRRRNQISSVSWGAGGNLTAIGPYAFAGVQKCARQDIPAGVLSVGANAFQYGGSALTVITVPQSVTSVGGSAFGNNSGLLSVVFHGKAMADVQAMANYPWGASGKIFVD